MNLKQREDISLELIKTIFTSKKRTLIVQTAVEMYAREDKKFSNLLQDVLSSMASGDESVTAFYNNNCMTKDTYDLLNTLKEKGSLGSEVIDIMIQKNKSLNELAKKRRSLFFSPMFLLMVGVFIGNFLIQTVADVLKTSSFGDSVQVSDIYWFISENYLLGSFGIIIGTALVVIFLLDLIMKKTGGIYLYLYQINIMIYFLRKAKTPYSEIFNNVEPLVPSGTRLKGIFQNLISEVNRVKLSHLMKDYLKLYPIEIMAPKLAEIDRGDDIDAFFDLSIQSKKLYDEYYQKISGTLPTTFLFLVFGYILWCLLPLFGIIGEVMSKTSM